MFRTEAACLLVVSDDLSSTKKLLAEVSEHSSTERPTVASVAQPPTDTNARPYCSASTQSTELVSSVFVGLKPSSNLSQPLAAVR